MGADVTEWAAVVTSISDEWLMSQCSSLLQITIPTDIFCPSLLCYHCSDAVLATGQLPVATMAYDLLLQWCAVVVYICRFLLIASLSLEIRHKEGKKAKGALRILDGWLSRFIWRQGFIRVEGP
jgi:hypothetical protein